MKDIKEFMAMDAFANQLGIVLTAAENGHARAQMLVLDEHLNAVKIAQGGVLFTLADLTLAAAANSYGKIAVSVSCNISFINPAQKGMIFAEAKEVSRNSKLGHYDVTLTNAAGDLLAKMTGTVYIKSADIQL